MRFLLPFIVLLATLHSAPSLADGSVTASVVAVKLYRGTVVVVSSDPNATTYRANFTPEACRIEKEARWRAEAATRTSGSIQYKCQVEERDTVTFRRPPPCPTPPAVQSRPGACPTGTTSNWTQTGTTTYGPAPACAPTVTWAPATPPADGCPPIAQQPLPAPTGLTVTVVSSNVLHSRWNVVPDAVAYSWQRCIGVGCTNFTQLLCIQELEHDHVTLPPGTTVRYRVAASRRADCSELGAFSDPPVQATTPGTVPNPPDPDPELPPTACTARQCTVSWTPGPAVAEAPVAGFRVVYGRTQNELTKTVQFENPAARSGTVSVDAAGVWYFGVLAYTANGRESVVSLVLVSRTVQ